MQPNSGAITAAIVGTASVEVVDPGVVTARLGETGIIVGVVAAITAARATKVEEAGE